MAISVVNLPNGKVRVDGVEMSRTTYYNRFRSTPAEIKSISSNPDKKAQLKKPTKKETKAETKTAKKNAKVLKKVDKANYSPTADAARKKAAARAKAVAPEARTPAQTRAIKTEARYRAGLPGYSAGPVPKELKKEQKAIEKKAARGPKAPRGGGGLRGGFGMGSGGGSGRSNVNR